MLSFWGEKREGLSSMWKGGSNFWFEGSSEWILREDHSVPLETSDVEEFLDEIQDICMYHHVC